MISPEALEKARAIAQSICDNTRTLIGENDIILIAAALQAAHDAAAPKLPDDLAGLVERLRAIRAIYIKRHPYTASVAGDAIVATQSLAAHNAELDAGLRGLLDCPDIADNDHKDEETHAAERVARSLLNKDRQP